MTTFRPPTPDELAELVPLNTILLGYRGSVTTGTFEPPESEFSTDDVDLMGVAVGPVEYYLGLDSFLGKRNTKDVFIGQYDVVTYELRKFVNLLCGANPNVLVLLWLPDEMYIVQSRAGRLLLNNRSLFATQKIFQSFTGYAHGQLHRMVPGVVPSDIAYLAGIFDGEGHVSIPRSDRKGMKQPFHHLDIGITNTDTDLIELLLTRYGGHAGSTGIRGQHRKDAFRWRLSGPQAAAFLKNIHPYLLIKKRQAEIGITFQHTVNTRQKGVPLTEEEIQTREDLKNTLELSRHMTTKDIDIPASAEIPDELRRYKNAYMGKKRKTLVERFGFDTKNAAHAIRLLRMGTEFLQSGYLNVYREDHKELLEIKHGEWSLERIKAEGERLFVAAQEAYDKSDLPAEPDMRRVNRMLVDILTPYT